MVFKHPRRRAAFTLVEALVSTSIVAVAGSALLLGASSALQTTTDSLDRTIAAGMARQLMDEIAGCRYADVDDAPYQTVLSASAWEKQGNGRERYDDIDDFSNFMAQPPQDLWGYRLGRDDVEGRKLHPGFRVPRDYLDRWRQKVEVYYVDETDPSVRLPAGQTSNYRAAEVRIYYHDPTSGLIELANVRRVFSYVPTP